MSKAVKCPVCGQTELVDDGDVCDVCKYSRPLRVSRTLETDVTVLRPTLSLAHTTSM